MGVTLDSKTDGIPVCTGDVTIENFISVLLPQTSETAQISEKSGYLELTTLTPEILIFPRIGGENTYFLGSVVRSNKPYFSEICAVSFRLC